MSTITVLLPDDASDEVARRGQHPKGYNTRKSIEVPAGSAGYWTWQVMVRAGLIVISPAEIPHLPYLGHIACPNDDLARQFLMDQHSHQGIPS